MGYRHGIYITEKPTEIFAPTKVESTLPVAFVTAPLHLTKNPYEKTNEPKLCYTYDEAVENFGFSLKEDIWNNYTACEIIYSQFILYQVAPIVIINVLDPTIHNEKIEAEEHTINNRIYELKVQGVLLDSIIIKDSGSKVLKINTDYLVSFNDENHVQITILDETITLGKFFISYTKLSPEKVDFYDFIGGYNDTTGKNTGLELVNEIYQRFRRIPSLLVVPKYSANPSVASVMEIKSNNINGHFRCLTINDLPTMTEDNKKITYTNIPSWKDKNNYTSSRQYNVYPKLKLNNRQYHFSTQMIGCIMKTDSENNFIPVASPSNKNLKIDSLCYENGDEIFLNFDQVNFLNGQGITTARNSPHGWVSWGNRTGAYSNNIDIKDSYISIRRIFDWISNQIILNYFSKIDMPITKRTIETFIDSINIWFNSLKSQEYILGGSISYLKSDNKQIDLAEGNIKFRIKISPPPPMEAVDFVLEYNPYYLETLLG